MAEDDNLLDGVFAVAIGDDEDVGAGVPGGGIGNGGVAQMALAVDPAVGATQHGTHAYLEGGAGTSAHGVEMVVLMAYDHDGARSRVGRLASPGKVCDEGDGVGAGSRVGVRGVDGGAGGAVAEIPMERGSAAGVVELDGVRGATCCGSHKFCHGEVVADVDAEDGVVAVVAAVGGGPCSRGGGEVVGVAAGSANRLIEGAELVESAGAAVDMIVATVGVVVVVRFAEEGGVEELRGVVGHGHDVEVLAVGDALKGIVGDCHAPSAGGAPGDDAVEVVAAEFSAPPGDVDAVADIRHEGSRGEVGFAGSGAEDGAPDEGV